MKLSVCNGTNICHNIYINLLCYAYKYVVTVTMQFEQKIGYKSGAMVRPRIESIQYMPFHVHSDSHEIICILNGRIKIVDDAASYVLGYGDVHIFNSVNVHRIEGEADNIVLTVHIDPSVYFKDFENLEGTFFISDTHTNRDMYSSHHSLLRFQLASIYREYSGKCSDMKLNELVKELFSLLIQGYRHYVYRSGPTQKANIVRMENSGSKTTNAAQTPVNPERMYRIVDYVYDHFADKLTLKQLAEKEYLSESYLSRYIKDTLGLTFSQLLSLARCEAAAGLLATSDSNMDVIAHAVGFANRNHLADRFRYWYGMTPATYRREILRDIAGDACIRYNSFDYEKALNIIDMYLDGY